MHTIYITNYVNFNFVREIFFILYEIGKKSPIAGSRLNRQKQFCEIFPFLKSVVTKGFLRFRIVGDYKVESSEQNKESSIS